MQINIIDYFENGSLLKCRDKVAIKEGVGLSGWVVRHGKPLVNGLASVEFAG